MIQSSILDVLIGFIFSAIYRIKRQGKSGGAYQVAAEQSPALQTEAADKERHVWGEETRVGRGFKSLRRVAPLI